MSICDEVDNFMSSPTPNQWISDEFLSVYVRKSRRLFNNQLTECIDVANISNEPEHRNQGHFRAFMLKVESLGLPVYVEGIHNPELVRMLEKNGYMIIRNFSSVNAIKGIENV